jgi:hypothetical protein
MVACRSCAAPIRFIETPSGKHMPVDAEMVKTFIVSDPPGDLHALPAAARVSLVTEHGEVRKGYEVSAIYPGAVTIEGFVPHWSTCTDPKAHRR